MTSVFHKRSPFARTTNRQTASFDHAMEGLESRQHLAADLAVGFDSFNGVPAVLVPGDQLSLPILVVNQGDDPAVGEVTINFYLSTNTSIDTDDVLLRRFADLDVSLDAANPGNTDEGEFSGDVTVPTIAPGEYFFLVQIVPNLPVGDLNQTNNVAASANDQTFAWLFGDFNGRSNVTMTLTGTDGVSVRFGMTGGGTGTVTRDATSTERFDVRFDNTTTNSRASFVAEGGTGTNAGISLIDDITVVASMNSIESATGRLLGDVTVGGTINAFRFNEVQGPSTIDIDGSTVNTTFDFGTVQNLSITTAGGIALLSVTSWVNTDTTADVVQARWITTLTSTGNFQASLILSGRPNGRALDSVTIGGTASKGAWDVNGRAGNWTFRVVSGDWSASIKNNLVSMTVTNIFRGTIAAKSFSTITLGGMRNGFILAGADLGADARRGGTDANTDTYSSGTINFLTITGKVVNVIVGAGLDPVDDAFKNGDDRLKTGRINNLVITKTVSPGSRFLAKRFPATGMFKISNRDVDPNADRRFRLDESAPPFVSAAVLNPADLPTMIRVTFKDGQALNASSIGNGDLVLVGPGGERTELTFVVPTNPLQNAATLIAEYLIAAPGGDWDAADNGDYHVLLAGAQVRDVVGNVAAETVIASFSIAL